MRLSATVAPVKRLLPLLVPLVILVGCSGGLSGDEKQACTQVTRDGSAALSAAGVHVGSLDRQAIANDYGTAATSIRSDVASLKTSSVVRKDAEQLASFYGDMARDWAGSEAGDVPQVPDAMGAVVKQLGKDCHV